MEMANESKDESNSNNCCNCFVCTSSAEKSKFLQRQDETKASKIMFTRKPDERQGWELLFRGETSTLGNLLRVSLLQDPRIRIAAQRIEHPSISNLFLLLACHNPSDDPIAILIDSIDREISKLQHYSSELVPLPAVTAEKE